MEHLSKWLSGLSRMVVCGGCKNVLDTNGGAGVFEGSSLGWTIELDGRGWLCPKCQRSDEKAT